MWLVRRGVAMSALPLLVAAVGGGMAVAGSGSGDDSGIKGRVVPCGIVLERPAPCAAPSKRGTVVVGRRRHVLRRAKVHADGSFRVRLDAGRYWLEPRSGGTRGPRVRATVAEGEWTTVTVVAGRLAPPRGR
jgi:hypothetical protein